MAIISVVKKSQIESTNRLDSEYYQPEYLFTSKQLQTQNTMHLSRLAYVSDGNHLKVAEKFLTEPGVRYLRGQDITSDMLIEDRTEIFIPDSVFTLLRRSHIFRDDVLITIVGANTGLVGLVYDPPEKLTANCKLGIARARNIDAAYLYAFLISKYGQNQIQQSKRGGGQTGLILPDMRNLTIARFSSTFENAIAKLINEGHLGIKNSIRLYTQSEQCLLAEIGILDWSPKHNLTYVKHYFDVENIRRMDAEYFQPKYTELREIIRNYPHGYFKLCDIAINSDEVIQPSAEPEREFEYIELANINQTIGSIQDISLIKGKEAPSRARMRLRQGDVIMSSIEGSLNKVAIVSDEFDGAIGSTGFFVLRPRFVESAYLLVIAKSLLVQEQMRCEASGTILAAVPRKSLGRIIIPIVPAEKRLEIATLVKLSHSTRNKAKELLERAKKSVEVAIEQNEEKAMEFLNAQ